MSTECPSEGCEIRQLCADLHKLGCGKDPSWLGLVLFVRNLVKLFSIFNEVQKQEIQECIFGELSRRDPSPSHLRQVIEQVEAFLARNALTDDLERQLESQRQGASDLARAVTDFVRDSLVSEEDRGRLIARFGSETMEALDSGEDAARLVPRLRGLVTDMLTHYRDEAQAWEHKARELERTVNVDPLLAPLHNRRALDEHLQKAVAKANAEGSPLTVFMIDVDNFKTTINDVYGHQVGDDVLRTLAKILGAHASQHGWFAARYGGDELVLVCALDADKAQLYAEAIRLAVQHYEFRPRVGGRLQDVPIRFTVSIGVAEYRPGATWQDLLGAADDAMYQVKGTGKNNVLRYDRSAPAS
jgi:diguanylate cyclase (GGDEF)-like protein